jgi:DNA-binding SARP family transcriptional activator/DNA-binding CsgD family transcriptional regulator
MQFRILGPLEVLDAGRHVAFGGRKQRALLVLLVLHANETLTTDRLIDELWGERPPATAAKTVQVHVSRLRKVLWNGAAGHGAIVTRERGYELRLDPERLDSQRFERLVGSGRGMLGAGRPGQAAALLEEALSLWRGEPLADLAYEPFAQQEIARLGELRVGALELLIEARLALGGHGEVVAQLEPLIRQHPYRERLRAQMMVALYRCDRQADALQAYQDARRALVEELGIEPGDRLRELERAILAQDPELRVTAEEPAPIGPAQGGPRDAPAERVLAGGGRTRGGGWARAAMDLEREEERAALEGSLAEARMSCGALTLIEGPAGIGKTRLLELARERAEAVGMAVVAARGGELERDFSFGVVRQLFERALAPDDDERRTRLTAGAASLGVPVFGHGPDAPDGPGPTHGVLHGLYWLTVNLAEEAPLLIAVDDLQWVDGPSLRFLLHLARRLEGLPIALVVSRRRDGEPEGPGLVDELALELRTAPIRPAPLSPKAVAGMLSESFGDQPTAELARACREVTGGNPFLLRELITELHARGVAPADLPIADVRKLGPERIATALLLRIGRLHASAPALAQALAVLGDSAQVGAAAELAGVDGRTAHDLARRLHDASVLADPEGPRFVHAIVRAAIYEDLSLARRAALHARAAALLREAGAPDEEVAAHVLASDPGSVPGASATLASAAAAAVRRGAPDSAARFLGRALEEEIDDRERARILAALGEAEHELAAGSAPERYLAAIDLTEDPTERARLTNALAWATGAFPDAHLRQLPLYERAATEAGDDKELAAMLEAARLFVLQINPDRTPELEVEAEKLAELEGKTPAERLLLSFAARRLMMSDEGRADEVGALVERAASKPVMIRSAPQPVWLINVADILNATERWDVGERLLTGVISEAERGGSVLGFVMASYFRSVIRHTRGDLKLAEEDAQAALGALDESLLGLWGLRPIVEVLADTGRAAEGEELLERHGYAGEIPPIRPLTPLLIARGRMRVNAGDLARGRADLEEALDRLRAGRSRGTVGLDAKLALADVLNRIGEDGPAVTLADEALAAARRWGTRRLLGGALRMRGVVAGDHAERLALLREAARAFEGSPVLLWRAEALVDLGTALHVNGNEAEARKVIAEGLDLADRAGANPLAQRAEAELARAGSRTRRRALTGVASLTASERRVAGMAAAGQSNKEIAQGLFVTLRTVEMHLSRAYAKLEISTRRELPDALAANARTRTER